MNKFIVRWSYNEAYINKTGEMLTKTVWRIENTEFSCEQSAIAFIKKNTIIPSRAVAEVCAVTTICAYAFQ